MTDEDKIQMMLAYLREMFTRGDGDAKMLLDMMDEPYEI